MRGAWPSSASVAGLRERPEGGARFAGEEVRHAAPEGGGQPAGGRLGRDEDVGLRTLAAGVAGDGARELLLLGAVAVEVPPALRLQRLVREVVHLAGVSAIVRVVAVHPVALWAVGAVAVGVAGAAAA